MDNAITDKLWLLAKDDNQEGFTKVVTKLVSIVEDKKVELRREYAMAAMQSIFLPNAKTFEEHAKQAFDFADAMMKAEGIE